MRKRWRSRAISHRILQDAPRSREDMGRILEDNNRTPRHAERFRAVAGRRIVRRGLLPLPLRGRWPLRSPLMSQTTPTSATGSISNAVKSMDDIVALCRRRGFIFQSSEIYGGINGFWDYGLLGAELKRNLKNAWWAGI